MGILSRLGYGNGNRGKDRRKAIRRHHNVDAWVRPDRSFAKQPCKLIDMSSMGVRISVERPEGFTGTFLLLTSRDGSSARRVKMKWRRGNQIGAEFV
jgi:hypothetical protein